MTAADAIDADVAAAGDVGAVAAVVAATEVDLSLDNIMYADEMYDSTLDCDLFE